MLVLDRFLDRVVRSSCNLLLASDFDGTLSRIVGDPDAASLESGAVAPLRRLRAAPRVQVAIVSGRTIDDLQRRCGAIEPAWLVGEHGAVLVGPDRHVEQLVGRPRDEAHSTLRRRAVELARAFRGARVETKPTSVALHYRDVPDDKHETLVQMFRLACASARARCLTGRRVLEGRFTSVDKGRALATVLATLPGPSALIYGGDDVTDEPAFELARRTLGLAFHVSSNERPTPAVPVDGVLEGPTEWVALLERIADRLSARDDHGA